MRDETSSTNLESKSERAKAEEIILKFWQEHKIFEQSLELEAPKGEFVFYDGPPFATGTPHYGHILAGTIKDVIPRYKTMAGYHVRRRWGWDCHGLPLENLVEKELGLKTKKDIEVYGLENFNEKARVAVLRYVDDWQKIIPRLGRFVDMTDSYRSLDPAYSETVWWIFKNLYDRDLIYEGYKSMHLCPRCETTLSNFEVTQGYKDVTDISVTIKFELVEDRPSTVSVQAKTYVLAWTTTPWTLPGNVALAINPEIKYSKIKIGDENYILAKDRLGIIKEAFEEVGEIKGKDLIGKKYQPVFDYYVNDPKLEHKENGWQIYGADFVTTEDGTGVVHIAPAFGDDDYQLSLRENLPFIQPVAMDGTFKPEVKDWPGQLVKPKDNPQTMDVEIIKYLASKKLLFAKEKFTHSYPHCWRCDTPLLNYAASSWFIKVTEFRDKLVSANRKVNWMPEHVRDGRFGQWLEGARDWAISRSRFWGAPLPVWRCQTCQAIKVFGSYNELAESSNKSDNHYWLMRHGEATANLTDSISADPLGPNHLTERGQAEVRATAQKLKEAGIDLIIASDFVRTKETATIMATELGLSDDQIIFDQNLREIDPGRFTGQTWREYNQAFGPRARRLTQYLPTGGENYNDIRRRVMATVYDLDRKYRRQNILIISHGLPLFMLQATVNRWLERDIVCSPKCGGDFATGEVRPLDFVYLPHDRNYELDVHRPYIDEVEFACACGGTFRRVTEVFDCWFESGAMPYAQDHYPFAKPSVIDPKLGQGFPADFIAEGLDQTRGWFYSLLVLGVALFEQSPYRQVVTNGMILAEDGQKMSKSLQNYPDPSLIVDRYGADALRLYLMSSPAVRGEDLNFAESGVAELQRRIIGRLLNTLVFYQTYTDSDQSGLPEVIESVLDRWILARLSEAVKLVSQAFDNYELDRAVRVLDDFVDDWSTWYVRRSRDRFKESGPDKQTALAVMHFVLLTTAKLFAPLAPFMAETIYQALRRPTEPLSVHLTAWPKMVSEQTAIDLEILSTMTEVRRLISLGLEFRQSLKIKVRQPLSTVKLKNPALATRPEYQQLIKDELNVKTVTFEATLSTEVWLDSTLTEELRTEGIIRELIRQIQSERKQQGLNQTTMIELIIDSSQTGRGILRRFETEIKFGTNSRSINYASGPDSLTIKVGDLDFKIKIVTL